MPKAFSEHEREIVKETMITIGFDLIRKKGIRQVTVEDITKGADIAKGSFYSFYKSREELLWDIIKREENQLLKKIKSAASENTSIKEKIRKIFYDLFLHDDCLVFYLPQEDLQYITRKLPPELLKADMEMGQNVIKNLLSMCGIVESHENVEIMMSMIHTLTFIASDEQLSGISKKKMLGILVESFADYLDKDKK